MKRTVIVVVLLTSLFISGLSSAMSLKDVYVGWFKPSDLNTWTAPWMLPVLYNESTNTTTFSAYYRNEAGPYTLNIVGAYAFHKFIGGDYMHASVNASYTTFTFNRYTVGIAVPNAGFDVRYVNVMDGKLHYYSEISMDVEFIYNGDFFGMFGPLQNGKNSKIFSYIKLFNLVRYIKPAYPPNSPWRTIFSMEYLIRTVWVLPQFALIYDDYNGMDAISYQPQSYKAVEILFKPFYDFTVRGGVSFENTASSAIPSVNIGAKFDFDKFNFDLNYQKVLSEPKMSFAISVGMNF